MPQRAHSGTDGSKKAVKISCSNLAKGVLTFVVTLTTFKDVRSYPCRSMEIAIKPVERFIASVIKPRPAPVGQSGWDPEATPAPVAEPLAA